MRQRPDATDQLHAAYWALKLSYGLMGIVVGVDKFFHVLVEWGGYTAPFFARLMPFNPAWFLYGAGVVEIVLGVTGLMRWTRQSAFLIGMWLLAVTTNLVVGGFYDIALRDFVLAAGAFTLAFLTPAVRREVGDRGA